MKRATGMAMAAVEAQGAPFAWPELDPLTATGPIPRPS